MAQIELTQLRNRHEGERKGHCQRISHPNVEENLWKVLSVFTIMTMESRTLFIVCCSHYRLCSDEQTQAGKPFLNMTGASDFNS